MEKRTFKSDMAAFFKKMQADKEALNACIRKGGNITQEAKDRGITLATPVWNYFAIDEAVNDISQLINEVLALK